MHEPRFRSIARFFRLLAVTIVPLAAGCSDPATTPKPTPPAGDPFGPLGDRADLPVDVVRDKDGRPHIYASSFEDAVRVQGYLVAQDRHLQIEFYRRVSEGRLAEILADADASVIDNDIVFRNLGLHRVAKKQYELLGAEEKVLVDAFADGVSQHFRALRDREAALPPAAFLVPVDAFTDFTGVDALAIARLQSYLLSHSADGELADTISMQTLGTAFPKDATDPKVSVRNGILRELFDFAPYDPATTTTGYPMGSPGGKNPAPSPALEVREHHLPEHAAAHVAARVHHDDVARPGVVQDVAVQLLLRLGVLVDLVEILALRHELQSQRRAGDTDPRRDGHGSHDVGAADAEPVEFAARRRAADRRETRHEVRCGPDDVPGLQHVGRSLVRQCQVKFRSSFDARRPEVHPLTGT